LRSVGDGVVDLARDAAIFERLMSLTIGRGEHFTFVYAAELGARSSGTSS
jgi:hypothetical protein